MNKVIGLKGYIFSLIIAFIVACSLSINLNAFYTLKESFNSNIHFFFVLFLLFMIFDIYINNLSCKKDNFNVKSIFSIVIALISLIGYSCDTYDSLIIFYHNKSSLFKTLLAFTGYYFICYDIISLVFYLLDNKFKIILNIINERLIKFENVLKSKMFKRDLTRFVIVAFLIFLAYIPYFLVCFPGNLTPDSLSQLSQCLGEVDVSNHHPIFHTIFIYPLYKIGMYFNNINITVALYSLIQMLFMSFSFSYVLLVLKRININFTLRLILFTFFAFWPINAIYSVTMWKDIPFSICITLLTTIIVELIYDKNVFFEKRFGYLKLILLLIASSLFRNNGIYVVVLSFPFIIFCLKRIYKPLILCYGVAFVVVLCWNYTIFNVFNFKDTSSAEALSIPMQGLARTHNFYRYALSSGDNEDILYYFDTEEIGKFYSPRISDNVKKHFISDNFNNNKMAFLELYLKLLYKYPRPIIDSFFSGNFGYYYPNVNYWKYFKGIDLNNDYGKYDEIKKLKSTPVINSRLISHLIALPDKNNIPFIACFFSIGFCFELTFALFCYCIYKKCFMQLLPFVPIFFVWLTCLASPVYAEFRYIYSLFLVFPILLFTNLSFIKDKCV